MHVEEQAGEWAADDESQRYAKVEESQDAPTHAIGKPVSEVKDGARKEACLKHAEKKT
jgi:hypothetical protein